MSTSETVYLEARKKESEKKLSEGELTHAPLRGQCDAWKYE